MAFLRLKSWCFPTFAYKAKNAAWIWSIPTVTGGHSHWLQASRSAVDYSMCHTRFYLSLKKEFVIELNSNVFVECPLTSHRHGCISRKYYEKIHFMYLYTLHLIFSTELLQQ